MHLSSLGRNLIAVVLLWFAAPIASYGNGNGASRQLAASPTSLNFGSVTVGMSSPLTVVVGNTGSSNVNLKQASVSGAAFTLKGPMLPLNLGPGQSTSFTVTFAPAGAGTANGSFSVASNATNPSISVQLTGSGVTGTGQLTPNPGSLNFGNVTVGTTNTLPVIVSNTGTGSATISQDSLTGSGFSLSGLAVPVSLAPGQSVSLAVTFAPGVAGTATGKVTMSGNAANSPVAVSVSGTATSAYGQIALNPTNLSFNNVTVGTSSTLPVAVSNTGTGSTTISQANLTGSGFSVSGLVLPLSLAPGQSTSFSVVFNPTVSGTVSGSVSLVSGATNSPTSLLLSGTGATAPGQLTPNPTSLSFGNVTVNTTSTLPVILSNTGTGSTTVSQANLSGSGFSLSGLALPLTLSPGQSTSFSVSFDPTSTGTLNGAVSLVSDASNSPTSLPLSGSGALTHSVNLSWTASTSTVSGYNVYRSSQSGGPYARLNSTPDTSTVYTDSTVQSGQTYYYVTTAVDTSGTESPYSNQASAVVPTP